MDVGFCLLPLDGGTCAQLMPYHSLVNEARVPPRFVKSRRPWKAFRHMLVTQGEEEESVRQAWNLRIPDSIAQSPGEMSSGITYSCY